MKGLIFAAAGAAVALGVSIFIEKGIKKSCQKAAEEGSKTSTVAKRLLK